jgi:hypothetical protein
MAASAYVDFGQVRWYLDYLHVLLELNMGPVHLQSQGSQGSARRFPSTVIVSNFPATPSSNTASGNNSTLINRSDIMEMKKLPAEKPDVRFEF